MRERAKTVTVASWLLTLSQIVGFVMLFALWAYCRQHTDSASLPGMSYAFSICFIVQMVIAIQVNKDITNRRRRKEMGGAGSTET